MKTKIFFMSTWISLMSASSAFAGGPDFIYGSNYFNGFFVGGTGSFHQVGFDGISSVSTPSDIVISGLATNYTIFQSGTIASSSIDGNAYDGYGGVQGGFGKVFANQWYLGVVGFGEWGSQTNIDNTVLNISNSVTIPVINVNSPVLGTQTFSTAVKITNDYGVAGKLGYLVSPSSMVYAKIGAIWANMKISNSYAANTSIVDNVNGSVLFAISGTASGSSSQEQNKIALLLGAGFEHFIYKNIISLNAEYDYANFGTIETGPTNLILNASTQNQDGSVTPINAITTPATTQASASAKVSTFLGGLNFYFGGNWF